MRHSEKADSDPLPFLAPEYDSAVPFRENEFRIYFIGNSITRHGVNAKTIEKYGWNRVCGMAASCEENDYAHLLAAKIQRYLPEKKVTVSFGKMEDFAASGKTFAPGLVVFQSGEHIRNEDVPTYPGNFTDSLQMIRNACPDAMIVVIGVWNPRCREEFKECTGENYFENAAKIAVMQNEVAGKLNVPFASVSEYENDPENTGDGKVAAVRWHPNDNGMRCYAESAFRAFLKALENKKTGN